MVNISAVQKRVRHHYVAHLFGRFFTFGFLQQSMPSPVPDSLDKHHCLCEDDDLSCGRAGQCTDEEARFYVTSSGVNHRHAARAFPHPL